MNWSEWIRLRGRPTWTAHGALHEGKMRPLCEESFIRAVEASIDRIEFDVLLFKGRLVMAHDREDARLAGTDLLSLEEGLAILSEGTSQLSCDIKSIGQEETIQEALLRASLQDKTLLCSHAKETLQVFKGFPCGWSLPQSPGSSEDIVAPANLSPKELRQRVADLLSGGFADWAQGLMLRHDIIDENIAALLKSRGMWLAAWTVDDRDVARRLLGLGVDNITSNYPFRVMSGFS